MLYIAGAFFGSLVITWLFSRLVLWLLRSMGKTRQRALAAFAVTWVASVVFAAYGLADGGPPRFGFALLVYTPATALWLMVELVRLPRQARLP